MASDAARLLESVIDLTPAISARSLDIESGRRLPLDLLVQLKSAGCFRMFTPKTHGGLEIDFPTSMEIIEALARADGSTGWVVMIGCETPMLLALMSPKRFDELYAPGPDLIIGGGFAPRGQAERQGDKYIVSGRWAFASGCQHADWLFGNCVVTENGQAKPGAIPGAPETRAMMFAPERGSIIDTWSVSGLRGTGSHDIAVENLTISGEDTFDIFGGKSTIPGPCFAEPLLYAALHIGAVGLGIATRGVEEILKLAATNKQRLYTQSTIANSQLFQYRIGHAETTVRAIRGLLRSEAELVWKSACEGRVVPPAERARIMGSVTWSAHTAASVVDTCYAAGGGTAPYETSPLQRCLRDIHTLTQHAAVAETWLSGAGAALLGDQSGFQL
ncbi:MAG TPA: acyl-CoA dehydrogenase family protein [Candidatus Binataceae bacterium]|nr:acyl-CoA dehydrogenase family protein [Candidatus Binataceae bacterium]